MSFSVARTPLSEVTSLPLAHCPPPPSYHTAQTHHVNSWEESVCVYIRERVWSLHVCMCVCECVGIQGKNIKKRKKLRYKRRRKKKDLKD